MLSYKVLCTNDFLNLFVYETLLIPIKLSQHALVRSRTILLGLVHERRSHHQAPVESEHRSTFSVKSGSFSRVDGK